MPRTKVPPGRTSNRSCSSASSWRAPNLSCCATSATDNPRSSRARESSAPMESVKGASLQGLVFGRAGESPAQLGGIALLGSALAELALDPRREPEGFRARLRELHVARHQSARFHHVALPVADLAVLQQR